MIDAAFALSAPSSATHITATTLSTRKTPPISLPNAANGLAFSRFRARRQWLDSYRLANLLRLGKNTLAALRGSCAFFAAC